MQREEGAHMHEVGRGSNLDARSHDIHCMQIEHVGGCRQSLQESVKVTTQSASQTSEPGSKSWKFWVQSLTVRCTELSISSMSSGSVYMASMATACRCIQYMEYSPADVLSREQLSVTNLRGLSNVTVTPVEGSV